MTQRGRAILRTLAAMMILTTALSAVAGAYGGLMGGAAYSGTWQRGTLPLPTGGMNLEMIIGLTAGSIWGVLSGLIWCRFMLAPTERRVKRANRPSAMLMGIGGVLGAGLGLLAASCVVAIVALVRPIHLNAMLDGGTFLANARIWLAAAVAMGLLAGVLNGIFWWAGVNRIRRIAPQNPPAPEPEAE